MSSMQKSEGQTAFDGGGKRADNPYECGTPDWTDWKDGFDQAEAAREQAEFREHNPGRVLQTG